MYVGRVLEAGNVDTIFHAPVHPYTKALLQSLPRMHGQPTERLAIIDGMVPSRFNRPQGCSFHPRCKEARAGLCDQMDPQLGAAGERQGDADALTHAAGKME
ncbi:oligopeptide/dipeptide ABC transporter ATP-binding protein, partial [Rhizobium leguminosarum]|uniref:oligopeptide/dipeptide ABC transporter ATP-binding protein n=1 Tax=Rhizobium leguminosarum TaxID=384 RepID=UPI003F99E4C9